MSTKTEQQIYSLNLSDQYVPNWKAWEVGREVICNAIDADPENWEMHTPNSSTLIVKTQTEANIAQMFVIGGGTKSENGGTIGQFGEGLKMAALAATRSPSGGFIIRTPNKVVTFHFKDFHGERVLHASVDEVATNVEKGMEVEIIMQGIALATAGKILLNASIGPQAHDISSSGMAIFNKGVFVTQIFGEDSLWSSFNFDDLKINRDRSMVDRSDLFYAMARWMMKNCTVDMAMALIENNRLMQFNHITLHKLKYGDHSDPEFVAARKCWFDAFKKLYGKNAIIAHPDDHDLNARLRARGMVPKKLDSDLAQALIICGVTNAAELANSLGDPFESVDSSPYNEVLSRLRKIADVLVAPNHTVGVFANRDVKFQGYAKIADNQVWIREDIIERNDFETVRVYLHELAHIVSGKQDCCREFEHTLDGFSAKLVIHAGL